MNQVIWGGLVALLLATPTPEPTETPSEPVQETPAPSLTPTPVPEWLPTGDYEIQEHEEPMLYPCMDCHADQLSNPNRRELVEMHDDVILKHGPASRWCLDCHNLDDRDRLKLASGETIPFTDSVRLCGQCHGSKLREWKVGVHGKVTGNMFDTRIYRTCVDCHNPHHPKFESRKPLPAPVRPEDIQLKKTTPTDVQTDADEEKDDE